MNIGSGAYGGGMPGDRSEADAGGSTPGRRLPRRLVAAVLLLLTVVAGLMVHTAAPDGAASDIAGDALYAIAVYLAVVVVAPRLRVVLVAVIATAWCTFVELFQLTGVPAALGAEFPPIMLVLGTVFDARDLVIYLVAVGVVALTDGVLARRSAE